MIRFVYEGLVCNDCAIANSLLWTDDYQAEGEMGVCETCDARVPVISTGDYVIPSNVKLIKHKNVLNMVQELELTQNLFSRQSVLYRAAVEEIEKLEAEVRMLKMGSKWSGTG